MRKVWFIIPALAVLVFAAMAFGSSSASADEGPHVKGWGATPDDCASCHRAHRGQAEALLIMEQDLLCESCHGNDASGSTLNVVSGTKEDSGGALRGGGFGTARIDTDDPSLSPAVRTILALPVGSAEPVQSSHSVDGSEQTIWGYGPLGSGDPGLAGFSLTCGKCHDPHGSGNYRALRTTPAGLLSYGTPRPPEMPDLTGKLGDEEPPNYTITDYWAVTYTDQWVEGATVNGIADSETSTRQVGKWCTTCHTRYLAGSESAEIASGDDTFAYRHTSNGEGRHTSSANPVTLSGACIKCHVAHGSNATMGDDSGSVEDPSGAVGSGASNSNLLKMNNRGICQKCHNK